MRNFEVQKFKQQEKHTVLVKPVLKRNSYIPKSTNEKNPTTEHTLIQLHPDYRLDCLPTVACPIIKNYYM